MYTSDIDGALGEDFPDYFWQGKEMWPAKT